MKRLSGIAAVPAPRQKAVGALPGLALRRMLLASWLGWSSLARGADTNAIQWPNLEVKPDPNAVRTNQTQSSGVPPQSPAQFSPDSGVPPFRTNAPAEPELNSRMMRTTNNSPPLPPAVFNPDPGAVNPTNSVYRPFYTNEIRMPPDYNGQPIDPRLNLPRTNVVGQRLEFSEPTNAPPYGSEPLDPKLALPREGARQNLPIPHKYEYPDYPLSREGAGYPTNAVPEPDRWRIGFAPWRRYTTTTGTPYYYPETMLWHPYKQSLLKGDSPIIGQDIFMDLTASSETVFEARRTPIPSGISSSQPQSSEFFGQSDSISVINNFAFSVDLFKGDTSFQPVHWDIHIQPVYNINYIQAHETGVVSPDPRGQGPKINLPPPNNSGIVNPGQLPGFLKGYLSGGPSSLYGYAATTRTKEFLSLQEAFAEIHISDLSDNYDFIATRLGNQPFDNDFRGFLFDDVNTGARVFGNLENNHYQYNVALFDLREKDTDSELNTLDSRRQRVFAANVYRQDFLWQGYTAQFSFLGNFDDGRLHYDENGNLVRPAPIGTLVPHSLQAFYLGWAGDGHIGRWNVSHQFYQALGHDDFNGLAGHGVDINAQMAAMELSYDRDWIRYKGSIFYASGDHKADSGTATGFDTVVDNPHFTGGPFSYWVRQGFNLGGTAVGLKQPNSLVPDLRSSKTEGQANFVNPGVLMLSLGTDIDVTPKLRSFFNVNYIRLMETDPVKTALLVDKVDPEIGWDLSVGVQYRPLLTDNIVVSAGFGALIPGRGYKDIYGANTLPVPGYTTVSPGRVDDFLYSGLIAVTFTY